MRKIRILIVSFFLTGTAFAQADSYSLPTAQLLSEPGPTFRIPESDLPSPLTFIVYGDQRFTDPANMTATNPRMRRLLVARIAEEKPGALILNGDVPLNGNVMGDYDVYIAETKAWRETHLHVFPALGNHEFYGDPAKALKNWWNVFPEVRNRRWYSAQLGSRIYIVTLDTGALLTPGSDQAKWLEQQLKDLPASIDAVVFSMHHPPVSDIQTHFEVSHNPRANEIVLRDYLTAVAARTRARFIVSAGHIHNYERHTLNNVIYLVSGGGGASPAYVERTPDDQYKSILFPNYHYVKFTLQRDNIHAVMYRVENPESGSRAFEIKDEFEIPLSGTAVPSVVQ